MKKSLHLARTLLLAMTLLVMSAACAFAAGADYEEGLITVEGMGVAPANVSNAFQARILSRRAAIVDAQRNLAEAVNGVNVDATTTVENMAVTSDVVSTHVNALIKGAKVVDEKYVTGGCIVTMQMPMFGVSNSLAGAVLPRNTSVESFPQPVKAVEPSPTAVRVDVSIGSVAPSLPEITSSAQKVPSGKIYGKYTGLIVDCRGLNLKPVMSPVIKNANGEAIYGYKNLDPDKVIEGGMAGYSTDFARVSRAGSDPLVVKAVSLENHNGNPVLSVADANRVLVENDATGFLDKTNVVFVR